MTRKTYCSNLLWQSGLTLFGSVDPSMKAFHGRIVAVVEASAIGEGSLAVSSAGLESANVVFSVTPRNCQRMEKTIE